MIQAKFVRHIREIIEVRYVCINLYAAMTLHHSLQCPSYGQVDIVVETKFRGYCDILVHVSRWKDWWTGGQTEAWCNRTEWFFPIQKREDNDKKQNGSRKVKGVSLREIFFGVHIWWCHGKGEGLYPLLPRCQLTTANSTCRSPNLICFKTADILGSRYIPVRCYRHKMSNFTSAGWFLYPSVT